MGHVYELEFLDSSEARIHTEDFVYEGSCPPIPAVDEVVYISGRYWIVTARFFGYHDPEVAAESKGTLPFEVAVKVSMHVKPRKAR